MNKFIGDDGWPCDFAASRIGKGLIFAIKKLKHRKLLTDDELSVYAEKLFETYSLAVDETLPRNRDATLEKSEHELSLLIERALALRDQINSLHRPAVSSLYREEAYIFQLIPTLEYVEESARHAIGMLSECSKDTGKSIVPQIVSEHCAQLFEELTDTRPTRISKDGTMLESPFTVFLSEIFDLLGYETNPAKRGRDDKPYISVESQAKDAIAALRRMEKSPPKMAQ